MEFYGPVVNALNAYLAIFNNLPPVIPAFINFTLGLAIIMAIADYLLSKL